jgi:hypothetical protein
VFFCRSAAALEEAGSCGMGEDSTMLTWRRIFRIQWPAASGDVRSGQVTSAPHSGRGSNATGAGEGQARSSHSATGGAEVILPCAPS